MNKRIVFIVLAALTLLATGCNKKDQPAKVSVSVKDRDPAKDEMGHQGAEKKIFGQNNNSTIFSIGNTGWTGFLWYQGGNNSMTYYGNGTFKALGTEQIIL